MRRWFDALSLQVRGVFATERVRRLGFAARALCQPAEMLTRRRRAAELAGEITPDLVLDEDLGFLRLPNVLLPGVDEVCDAGRAIAATQTGTNSPGGKAFHRNKLAKPHHMRALLRIALDRRMIAVAAKYLGVLPVLGDVDYFMSLPSKPPWSKSQLWHCDDDAPRQLKLFIYCDDVGDDNGPFEMIAAADSRRVRDRIGYRYAGRRYRVSDELMDRHLLRDKQLSIRGPRASAFLVDTTRCFHKGSRIVTPSRWRMVAVIQYCTPNGSRLPLRLASRPGPYASLITNQTDELEAAVLGSPLEQ